MYKMIYSMAVLVALIPLLAGCGQSADGLVQRQADQLNELADALEAGAEQAEIAAIENQVEETSAAIEGLDLSDDEKKRLTEEYGGEMTKAVARVTQAKMSEMGGMMQGMMEGMQGNMPKGFGETPQAP